MIDRVRVVVMGEPEHDTSEFVRIDEVEPIVMGPSQQWWNAWGWDSTIDLPWHSAAAYEAVSHFPGVGGGRVLVARFPAADIYLDEPPENDEQRAGTARIQDMLAAVDVEMTSVGSNEAMHRTNTVDIGFVVEGEVDIQSSNGTSQTLKTGDIYVNNGAVHAWKARDVGATIFFVVLGADRAADE